MLCGLRRDSKNSVGKSATLGSPYRRGGSRGHVGHRRLPDTDALLFVPPLCDPLNAQMLNNIEDEADIG